MTSNKRQTSGDHLENHVDITVMLMEMNKEL